MSSRITSNELSALKAFLAPTNGHFMEIGTLHGGTAKSVAESFPSRTVVTIDNRIYDNMVDFPGNVIRILGDSYNISRSLHGLLMASFGLIFIDGDHRYPVVKQDMLNYSGYLMWRGILAFHDSKDTASTAIDGFSGLKEHKGVSVVIDEMIYSGYWAKIKVVDTTTFLRRHET